MEWIFPWCYFCWTLVSVIGLHTNLEPIRVYKEGGWKSFAGSKDDLFKVVFDSGQSLLIGSRDVFYNVSTHDMTELGSRTVWEADEEGVTHCRHAYLKMEKYCHNFVMVITPTAQGGYLVCGTYAFKPRCRNYQRTRSEESYISRKESEGAGILPPNPLLNATFLYLPTGDQLYSATATGTLYHDTPVIYKHQTDPHPSKRQKVRTPYQNVAYLNGENERQGQRNASSEPHFVGMTSDPEFVYTWFREVSVDSSTQCGRRPISSVARVCRDDAGRDEPGSDAKDWTTYLKARLNCSIGGNFAFMFDEIQAISEVTKQNSPGLIYAVFSTPWESLHASALCVFDMGTVRDHFFPSAPDGGPCAGYPRSRQRVTTPGTITALHSNPMYVDTSMKLSFTAVAVSADVRAANGETYDVIFIGTSKGTVLKLYNADELRKHKRLSTVLTAEVVLPHSPGPVRKIQISGAPLNPFLLVTTDARIFKLPVDFCSNATTCAECVSLRDPYCAWNTKGWCQSGAISGWSNYDTYIQELSTGFATYCPHPHGSTVYSSVHEGSGAGEYAKRDIAIAVVITLFVASIVGFVAGYLLRNRWANLSRSSSLDRHPSVKSNTAAVIVSESYPVTPMRTPPDNNNPENVVPLICTNNGMPLEDHLVRKMYI